MNDFIFYVDLILFLGLLPTHLALGPSRRGVVNYLQAGMVLCWLIFLLSQSFVDAVRFRDLALGLGAYSVCLFVLLSQLLMFPMAHEQTR
jgi:hypothetical protein